MNKIMQIYKELLKMYGHQGWWPIINNNTLLCEYHLNAPRNEEERFEIAVGAILAQNTQWYPNVVRAIQQLKVGRLLKKEEWEVIKKAEIHKGIIRERPRKQTTNHILTQNTSWKNVEKAIKNLKEKNFLNKETIQNIPEKELALLIRPAGYYNQKARKLKAFVKFDGRITRENLLNIWGLGPETVDSILLYAYNKPIFVIDAYTKRVMNRLGYKEQTYDELQSLFMKSLPEDTQLFNEFHALLVELGKNYCKTKPLCEECPIKKDCSNN